MTEKTSQLGLDDLKTMTPAEVARATLEGRCNALLRGEPTDGLPATDAPVEEWIDALAHLTDEDFTAAVERGRVPDWLTTDDATPPTSADQGARGDRSGSPLQRLLRGKSPDEIARLTKAGAFDSFLRGEGPVK